MTIDRVIFPETLNIFSVRDMVEVRFRVYGQGLVILNFILLLSNAISGFRADNATC